MSEPRWERPEPWLLRAANADAAARELEARIATLSDAIPDERRMKTRMVSAAAYFRFTAVRSRERAQECGAAGHYDAASIRRKSR